MALSEAALLYGLIAQEILAQFWVTSCTGFRGRMFSVLMEHPDPVSRKNRFSVSTPFLTMLILDSQKNGKTVVNPWNDLLHFQVTRKTSSVPLLNEDVNENNSIISSDIWNRSVPPVLILCEYLETYHKYQRTKH